ncbi:MAG: hypothetical protein HQK51_04145 [Oligoflexia bacterium]|nr:hypothetical protein [Oligoflexia bacterium]
MNKTSLIFFPLIVVVYFFYFSSLSFADEFESNYNKLLKEESEVLNNLDIMEESIGELGNEINKSILKVQNNIILNLEQIINMYDSQNGYASASSKFKEMNLGVITAVKGCNFNLIFTAKNEKVSSQIMAQQLISIGSITTIFAPIKDISIILFDNGGLLFFLEQDDDSLSEEIKSNISELKDMCQEKKMALTKIAKLTLEKQLLSVDMSKNLYTDKEACKEMNALSLPDIKYIGDLLTAFKKQDTLKLVKDFMINIDYFENSENSITGKNKNLDSNIEHIQQFSNVFLKYIIVDPELISLIDIKDLTNILKRIIKESGSDNPKIYDKYDEHFILAKEVYLKRFNEIEQRLNYSLEKIFKSPTSQRLTKENFTSILKSENDIWWIGSQLFENIKSLKKRVTDQKQLSILEVQTRQIEQFIKNSHFRVKMLLSRFQKDSSDWEKYIDDLLKAPEVEDLEERSGFSYQERFGIIGDGLKRIINHDKKMSKKGNDTYEKSYQSIKERVMEKISKGEKIEDVISWAMISAAISTDAKNLFEEIAEIK